MRRRRGLGRHRPWIDAEAVVLGGDRDGPVQKISDGVVSPVVAKAEFVGTAAESQAKQLVSETYPEDRDHPEELPNS